MTNSKRDRTTDSMTARTTSMTSATTRDAARQAQPWTWSAAERRARFGETLRSIAVENRLARRVTSDE